MHSSIKGSILNNGQVLLHIPALGTTPGALDWTAKSVADYVQKLEYQKEQVDKLIEHEIIYWQVKNKQRIETKGNDQEAKSTNKYIQRLKLLQKEINEVV